MWVERIADRPELILPVARNMREWDKREIYATRFTDDPELLAKEVEFMGKEVGWVAGLGDQPIAAFGCFLMWPGVWSMWLFATDDFGRIGISMTKLIVRSIVPMLFEGGAHRLEARSMDGHVDAQRWLEVIGARREGGPLKGYGRAGQDFHVYTWGRC
jgi:RimJ/RimL family protein N-acetyltransferase